MYINVNNRLCTGYEASQDVEARGYSVNETPVYYLLSIPHFCLSDFATYLTCVLIIFK